ncbi:hypothetical protein KOAAANKH_03549 [Brevundimonas sp. NIBR10]|uniref:DUF2948 family protein n=1 Tax=Brevundimonas sp. NIBR10 TaxID=3015997 RepID=UPI0022F1B0D3|nr:DUF2948 family protein [Brevundimonas sp. NIBR10]WGM48644.1 hypothetical protein KOAAANKH_03549 [Brevundimonas sp. NIBR10]
MSTDTDIPSVGVQPAAPTEAEVAAQVESTKSGANEPLRLLAEDAEDLAIISAALQDAILRPADIVWERPARRLTLTLSRFCWECGGTRVMAAMQFGDVLAVKSRGLPRLPDTPLELLAIDFEEGEAPGGKVTLMFAGGGDLRAEVECLDAVVADLSDRWEARVAPTHLDGEESES